MSEKAKESHLSLIFCLFLSPRHAGKEDGSIVWNAHFLQEKS